MEDNRSIDEIKADIYEIAHFGYDQKQAQEWVKKEIKRMLDLKQPKMEPVTEKEEPKK